MEVRWRWLAVQLAEEAARAGFLMRCETRQGDVCVCMCVCGLGHLSRQPRLLLMSSVCNRGYVKGNLCLHCPHRLSSTFRGERSTMMIIIVPECMPYTVYLVN